MRLRQPPIPRPLPTTRARLAAAPQAKARPLRPQPGSPWRTHVHTNLGGGTQSSKAGYDGYSINNQSVTLGLDHSWERLRLGAAANLGQVEQNYDSYNGKSDSDIWQLGLYASTRYQNLLAGLDLSVGRAEVDTRRDIPLLSARAEADWHAWWFGAGLHAAYLFDFSGIELTPVIGAAWLHTKTPSYDESWQGTAPGALHYASDSYDSFELQFNLAAQTTIEAEKFSLTPYLDLGVAYELADRQVKLDTGFVGAPMPMQSFSTQSWERNRFSFNTGAGLALGLGENVSVTLGYQGDFSEGYNYHSGNVMLEVSF